MTVADLERIGAPTIDRTAARRAYVEYREAVLHEADAARKREYDGLMRGYRAIARGQQVLDLAQAMQAAGLQEATFYPRLAICRADATWCRLRMEEDGSAVFSADNAGDRAWTRQVRCAAGTFPTYTRHWRPEIFGYARNNGTVRWSSEAQAMVPLVPPALKPRAHLANYHILWDAVWTAAPPVDPLLLRHLAGELYAIVAAWDLSPLEQAVLRGRLTTGRR